MMSTPPNESASLQNWFHDTGLYRYYTRLHVRSFLSVIYLTLLTLSTLYTFVKGIDEFFCLEKRYEVVRSFTLWDGISNLHVQGEGRTIDAFDINNDTNDCGMNFRNSEGHILRTFGDEDDQQLSEDPSYLFFVIPVLYSFTKWNATFYPKDGTLNFTDRTNEVDDCAIHCSALYYDKKCEMKEKTRDNLYAGSGLILGLFLILFLTTPLDLNNYYMLRKFKDVVNFLKVGENLVLGNPITQSYTVHTSREKYCILSDLDNLDSYKSDFYSNKKMHIRCYMDGNPGGPEKTFAESREFYAIPSHPEETSAESSEFNSSLHRPETPSLDQSSKSQARSSPPDQTSAELSESPHGSTSRLDRSRSFLSRALSSTRNSQPNKLPADDVKEIPLCSMSSQRWEYHHGSASSPEKTEPSEGNSQPCKVLLVDSEGMSLHSLERAQWENFCKYLSLIKLDSRRCCTEDVAKSTWHHPTFREVLSRMEADRNLFIKEDTATKTFYSLL